MNTPKVVNKKWLYNGDVAWYDKTTLQLKTMSQAIESIDASHKLWLKLSDFFGKDAEIESALLYAAIIRYARPFVGEVIQNKKCTPSIRNIKAKNSAFCFDRHSSLIDMRNKLIAHKDHEYLKPTILIQSVQGLDAFVNFQDKIIKDRYPIKNPNSLTPWFCGISAMSYYKINSADFIQPIIQHTEALVTFLIEETQSILGAFQKSLCEHPELIKNPKNKIIEEAPLEEEPGLVRMANPRDSLIKNITTRKLPLAEDFLSLRKYEIVSRTTGHDVYQMETSEVIVTTPNIDRD